MLLQMEQSPLQKLARHLRRPGNLPALVWKNVTYPFSRKARARASETKFDRSLGIDTGGTVHVPNLGVDEKRAQSATAYDATPARIAEHLIDLIADRARGFTFIDMGSGKGRVLLLAARRPFARVVGVELSERLCRIARDNAAKFARRFPDLAPISIHNVDAAEYRIPDGPCVLYFYNPFDSSILDRIVANMRSSYERNPRKIVVVYYNPKFPDVFGDLFVVTDRVEKLPPDPMDRFGGFEALVFETRA